MRVSVVIPAHNEEKTIGTVLGKLRSQTLKPIEVIVVDDASTDNTSGVSKKYGVKVVKNETKIGLAKCLNRGIKESNGEVIVTLHADCVPVDDKWLENLVRWLKEPMVGAVTSRVVESFSEGANVIDKIWASQDLPPKYPETWHEIDFITDKCDAYRKDILEKLGLFNERFITTNEDIDLSLKMKKNGYKIIREPRSMVYKLRSSVRGSLYKYYKKMFSYSIPRSLIFLRYGVPKSMVDIGVKYFFNLILLFTSTLCFIQFFDLFFVVLMSLFVAIYRPSHLYAKDIGIQFLIGYLAVSLTQIFPGFPFILTKIPLIISIGIILQYTLTSLISARTVYEIDAKASTFILSSIIFFLRNFIFGVGFFVGLIKIALRKRL